MFRLTDAAGSLLASLLDDVTAPRGAAVRLRPCGKECLELRLDYLQSADAAYQFEERTVLLVDADLVERQLAGCELEVADLGAGPQLTLERQEA